MLRPFSFRKSDMSIVLYNFVKVYIIKLFSRKLYLINVKLNEMSLLNLLRMDEKFGRVIQFVPRENKFFFKNKGGATLLKQYDNFLQMRIIIIKKTAK